MSVKISFHYCVTLYLCLTKSVFCNEIKLFNESDLVIRQWVNISDYVDNLLILPFKNRLEKIVENNKLNISERCQVGLQFYLNGIETKKKWAYKMVDATSRLPSGIFEGGFTNFGDYDECKKIRVPLNDLRKLLKKVSLLKISLSAEKYEHFSFKSRYCLVELIPPIPKTPASFSGERYLVDVDVQNSSLNDTVYEDLLKVARIFRFASLVNGICVPSSCDNEDIDKIMRYSLTPLNLTCSLYCNDHDEDGLSYSNIIAITFIFLLMLMVGAGSLTSLKSNSFFSHFNATEHIKSLFKPRAKLDPKKSEKLQPHASDLEFLDGLRVLSAYTVTVTHLMILGGLIEASIYLARLPTDIYQIIHSWPLHVMACFLPVGIDTFFAMSGLLQMYLRIKQFTSSNQPSAFRFILEKWFRFTSVLVGLLSILYVLPLLSDGPVFSYELNRQINNCKKHLWRNLLYINNHQNLKDMCLIQTWYLGADMQLHIISYLVLFTLRFKHSLSIALMMLLIISGSVICGLRTYLSKMSPFFLYDRVDSRIGLEQFTQFYLSTSPHLTSYFGGMLLGYFLYFNKRKQLFRMKFRVLLAFFIIIWLSFAPFLFAPFIFNTFDVEMTNFVAVAYAMLARPLFAGVIFWFFVYYCSDVTKTKKEFRLFNLIALLFDKFGAFLSSKYFLPLSRLSLSLLMLHFFLIWHFILQSRTLVYFSLFFVVTIYIMLATISTVAAAIFHLIVEAPSLSLIKLYISTKPKRNIVIPPGNNNVNTSLV